MKKLILSLLAVVIAAAGFAQNTDASNDNLNRAVIAYEMGNLELAMQYIQKQCDEDCNFPTRYLAMMVLYQAGEYELAGQLAEQLLPYVNKDAHDERNTLYGYMGVAACEKGDYKGAIKLLNKALKEDSKSSWAYYERGYVYSDQGKYDAAIKDLLKSAELDSTRIDAYTLAAMCYQYKGDMSNMEKYYQEAVRRTEGQNPYVVCEYGAAYLELGRTDEAIDKLFEAFQIDMENARTGRFYNRIQEQKPQELLARLQQKAAEEPYNAAWEALLGDCYETADSLALGYRHYRIASLMDPTQDNGISPLKRLAKAYAHAEDYEAALALVREGMEAAPQDLVWRRLEHVYTYNSGNIEAALPLAERLMVSDEKQHDALMLMSARYLYDLGRYEEAMVRCLEYMKIDPEDTDLTLLMGYLYQKQGKTAEAESNFRILVKNADGFYDYEQMKPLPMEKTSMDHLGPFTLPRALMGMGRKADAQEVVGVMNAKIRKVLTDHPDVELDGALIYNLACTNAQVELFQDALEMLEVAERFGYNSAIYIEQDPDFGPLVASGNAEILMRWQQILNRMKAANAEKAALIHSAVDGVELTAEQRMRK